VRRSKEARPAGTEGAGAHRDLLPSATACRGPRRALHTVMMPARPPARPPPLTGSDGGTVPHARLGRAAGRGGARALVTPPRCTRRDYRRALPLRAALKRIRFPHDKLSY